MTCWSTEINDRLINRFSSHVEKVDQCWEWTGARNPKGYGVFAFGGRIWKAHRFAWLICFGEIPEGMHVCHKCDNPACVNSDHLFLGDDSDNLRDAVKKSRVGRLSVDAISAIRRGYAIGKFTQQELADTFGVDRSHIGYIVRNEVYVDIGGEL